ncbi:OLC1v1018964C1 [Oldenlandia corymbosa var. corymbosa]|uniref:GTPase Der n=1 Tax=Oldenlandia corymbosa var. corymbosa TaxID=529605 RepID=A0AAV1ED00_OLDCO|nr:OLC1v1018964C1 [Oldenlandia corymbosa var. corymbosa]
MGIRKKGMKKGNRSLVGKVFGEKKVNFFGVKNAMEKSWKQKGLIEVETLQANTFQFVFASESERDVRLKAGYWKEERREVHENNNGVYVFKSLVDKGLNRSEELRVQLRDGVELENGNVKAREKGETSGVTLEEKKADQQVGRLEQEADGSKKSWAEIVGMGHEGKERGEVGGVDYKVGLGGGFKLGTTLADLMREAKEAGKIPVYNGGEGEKRRTYPLQDEVIEDINSEDEKIYEEYEQRVARRVLGDVTNLPEKIATQKEEAGKKKGQWKKRARLELTGQEGGKVGFKDRLFMVEQLGRKGGTAVGWSEEVVVYDILSSEFSIEEQGLGRRWFIGDDFNDIGNGTEKRGGRIRRTGRFLGFCDFIRGMEMEEVDFVGRNWTWANNRDGEGFIEKCLDRFFGSIAWLVENGEAKVLHVEGHSSDHCMLVLDTKPETKRKKSRFYFDKRWIGKSGVETIIKDAWSGSAEGSPMHQLVVKIKRCRLELLKWSRGQNLNPSREIKRISGEMDGLKAQGGARDWDKWKRLKEELVESGYLAAVAYPIRSSICSQNATKNSWHFGGNRIEAVDVIQKAMVEWNEYFLAQQKKKPARMATEEIYEVQGWKGPEDGLVRINVSSEMDGSSSTAGLRYCLRKVGGKLIVTKAIYKHHVQNSLGAEMEAVREGLKEAQKLKSPRFVGLELPLNALEATVKKIQRILGTDDDQVSFFERVSDLADRVEALERRACGEGTSSSRLGTDNALESVKQDVLILKRTIEKCSTWLEREEDQRTVESLVQDVVLLKRALASSMPVESETRTVCWWENHCSLVALSQTLAYQHMRKFCSVRGQDSLNETLEYPVSTNSINIDVNAEDKKDVPVKPKKREPIDFTEIDINKLPTVLLIGRPNVGKSALFNRLIRRREALVYNTPTDHVTRDIREGVAKLGDLRFRVLDSAGLEAEASSGSVLSRSAAMTKHVLARSQFALFLIDGRDGLHDMDLDVGKWLRKHAPGIKTTVVINKSEMLDAFSGSLDAAIGEACSLGFGDPVALSAETGFGLSELHEALKPLLEEYMLQESCEDTEVTHPDGDEHPMVGDAKLPLQLAIVGRPNVGKSTLLNAILEEDRVLVGPEAGLTRDSIRVQFEYEGRTIYLVDTAGWLERTHQEKGPSSLSIVQSRKHLMRAHVIALVLDAEEISRGRRSMKHAEVVIARQAVEEGRGLVVIVNKMDLFKGQENKKIYDSIVKAVPEEVQTIIPQVTGIPVIFVSALEGQGKIDVMHQVVDTYEKWCSRLTTARLNRWLLKVMSRHSWKDQSSQPKIKYFTQVKARPPTFVAFVSGKKQLSDTVLRFLTRSLKEDFDLGGIPVRIMQRSVIKTTDSKKIVHKNQPTPKRMKMRSDKRKQVTKDDNSIAG